MLAVEHPQTRHIPETRQKLIELKGLVQFHDIWVNVEMVAGEVDVPTFFNSLDAFVYAIQTTEGMVDIPPTILECLAGGCALISTPKGGIPEVMRSYENGILVKEIDCDNPRAYADKIMELIENRDLLSRIRVEARRSVEAYDVNEVAPQVMRANQEIS